MRKVVSKGEGRQYGVTVIRREGAPSSNVSRQDYEDRFVGVGGIINPPYKLSSLRSLIEQSNILPQTIESKYTNIAGYGFRVVAMDEGTEIDPDEKELLQSFIKTPNPRESLSSISKLKIKDYESYGYSCLEVIRDARGVPAVLKHAKAYFIRVCSEDSPAQPITVQVSRGKRRSTVTEYIKFKKFVQMSETSTKKVYFKEFGDPRHLNYDTGEYETTDKPVPPAMRATELLFHAQPSESVYGTPRWISQVPNLMGSREAEEVNLDYFMENTVPPIMISVSNGRLTRQSFGTIQDTLNNGRGREAQNRVILIEAIAESIGLDDKANASIKVDKLADARPSDGLFDKYDERNINKVLSSFRIDPMLVGMGGSKTFASANVAISVTESQVFQPDRLAHDEFINKGFINNPKGLALKTCKLESKSPAVTNPEQVIRMLTAINTMGGVTPRTAIDTINETMQLSLPQYPTKDEPEYEEWMDLPLQMSLRDRISNTQQTGEGDTTHLEQSTKTTDNKSTEKTGKTGPDTANNKMDKGQLPT